jgi:hypothetical protein
MLAPTVAVSLPSGTTTVNGATPVTFTFSEAVAGFSNADVTVANGTLSNVTTSDNKVWTATYTPTPGVTNASNLFSVAANSYTDVAGNNGGAGQVSFSLDTSLNGATRAADGVAVGYAGMTNGVFDLVHVYAYYNPLFVGGVVTVYVGSTVVSSHTITAGDSGNYAAYLSPSTNSSGGQWTITSAQIGSYSAVLVYNGVSKTLPQMYNLTSTTGAAYTSPLVLDLNGDGVHTVDTSAGVVFDLAGTGHKQVTSWVDRHDGLLAIDLNGDGQINSGTELLGSGTQLADGSKAADGWQALAQHDTNADGKIDAADAVFSQLRVWVDANGDGVTDAGELSTMADVGIVDINLAADDAMVAQNGNYLRGFSSYTTADGVKHEVVDAWLLPASPNEQQGASANGELVFQNKPYTLSPAELAECTDASASSVYSLSNGQKLDLSVVLKDMSVNGVPSSSLEKIDMATDTAANTLKLNLSDVLSLPTTNGMHQLTLTGDANDTVDLDIAHWTNTGTTVTDNGHSYAVYNTATDSSAQLLIDQHMLLTQHS